MITDQELEKTLEAMTQLLDRARQVAEPILREWDMQEARELSEQIATFGIIPREKVVVTVTEK